MTGTQDSWPAGATWVFQGTVAEDGTGGTHVCSLTVTPGSGSEFTVQYGMLQDGATATAQIVSGFIDDGSNILTFLIGGAGGSSQTTSGLELSFPSSAATLTNAQQANGQPSGLIVSGTMRLVLKVTTAAISVTQTFAVVCRIKGAMPTAVLADSVGTPTLTTNTNKVF